MINIYYSSEEEILHWEFNNTITKSNILDSIEEIKEYSLSRSRLKIYCNSLNAKLDIKHTDLIEISQKAHSYMNLFDNIRLSVVVEAPKATAFFMMTFMNLNDIRFKGKVFSTLDAAKIWLNKF